MTDPPRRTKTSRWRLLYLNYILHNAKHVNLSNVLVSLTHLLPSHCYNYHIAQTISFDDCWIWHYLPNDCDHLKRLQPFVHCCSFPASYVFGIVVADEKVRSAFHLPPSFLSATSLLHGPCAIDADRVFQLSHLDRNEKKSKDELELILKYQTE